MRESNEFSPVVSNGTMLRVYLKTSVSIRFQAVRPSPDASVMIGVSELARHLSRRGTFAIGYGLCYTRRASRGSQITQPTERQSRSSRLTGLATRIC